MACLGYSTRVRERADIAFLAGLARPPDPGFDVIHACNPPDTIFLIAGFFRLFFGKRFIFDHHDINPELYEAKFGRRDFIYKTLLLWLERMTFRVADISIATNQSYRQIAITRGGMKPENVFVVRSGPNLKRLTTVEPNPTLRKGRAFPRRICGRHGTAGGHRSPAGVGQHLVTSRGAA